MSNVGWPWFRPFDLNSEKSQFAVIHLERATVLCRVAAVFSQPHLNAVSGKHRGPLGIIAPRQYPEAQHGFVKRDRGIQARDRQVHVVTLIAFNGLEFSFHCP